MTQKKIILLSTVIFSAMALYKLGTKNSNTDQDQNKSPRISINDKESIREAERQALRKELAPEEKWIADVKKNDIKTLKRVMKQKTGFDVKEIKENPDGSYNATLNNGTVKQYKKMPFMSKKEFSKFRNDFISSANKGKNVRIDGKDLEAIKKFRRMQ